VITRESGVNNRQSLEWQKDIQIVPASMYLQMFTLNRYVKAGGETYYDVCDVLETYNADGVRFGKKYEAGPRESAYSVLSSTTNRLVKYGSTTSGISAYASYDSCNVGTFEDNKLINNSHSISVRTQGDNKLYVNFKSSVGNDRVAKGEKWIIDVAYGADYLAPEN
jgi:dynactin complex subunit